MKVTLDLWHQLINYNFKANSPIWTNDVHNRYIYPGVSWTGRSTAYQGDGVGQVDNHGGEFFLRSFLFAFFVLVWSLDFSQATMTSRTSSSRSTPTSTQRLLGEVHLCVGIGVFRFKENCWNFSGKRSFYVNWKDGSREAEMVNWLNTIEKQEL